MKRKEIQAKLAVPDEIFDEQIFNQKHK